MTQRLYELLDLDRKTRLVAAASPAQAREHVLSERIPCKVASGVRVAQLVAAGATVETAGLRDTSADDQAALADDIAADINSLDKDAA